MVTPVATELPPESMLVDGSQPTRVVALGGGVDVAASSGAASTLSTLEVRASRRSPAPVLAFARDRAGNTHTRCSQCLSLTSPQEAKSNPKRRRGGPTAHTMGDQEPPLSPPSLGSSVHRVTPMLLLLLLVSQPCSGARLGDPACPYHCTGQTCHIVQTTVPKQLCAAWAVVNQHVAYLKIPKASSTTVTTSLARSHADYVLRPLHTNASGLDKLRCVFTFVRDPIERFISGYRELISRISKVADGSNSTSDRSWPFWSVRHEPARFRQFVDDLLLYGDQMTCFGHISHAVSQTNYLQRFASLLPTMVPFFWAAMDGGSNGETQRQRMFAAVRGQCGADISDVLASHLNPGSNKKEAIPSLSNTSQVREQFLDAETSSKVHWLLRDDIRCFGYDR